MKKRIKKQVGFTYIELIVSILIISLMSALFMANYHSTNEKSKLNIAAQKLVSDIRLAQNYSLALKDYDGDFPDGGWGIYFDEDETEYTVFADLDENYYLDSANEGQESKGAKIMELPDGVTISSINVGDELSVIFLPPDPIVYVNANKNTDTEITITDGNLTETISINFLGLVEIK